MDDYFQLVQKATLPGVWSRGVALSRAQSVIQERSSPGEWVFRVLIPGRAVSPKVSLIPADEDWFCDCEEKANPCSHVAAAVVAMKTGAVVIPDTSQSSKAAQLQYRFVPLSSPQGTALGLERTLQRPGKPDEKLNQTLVSYVGGISSGRISAAPLPATQEDFAIDQTLGTAPSGSLPLSSEALHRLLKIFQEMGGVRLRDSFISCSGRAHGIQAELVPETPGYRLRRIQDDSIIETFINGAVMIESTPGGERVLKPASQSELTPTEQSLLQGNHGQGTHFGERDLLKLISEILPRLQSKIQLTVRAEKLPVLRKVAPRIEISVENGNENGAEASRTLSVMARLVYGNPILAEVIHDQLDLVQREVFPERDLAAEKLLIRKLQTELFLQPRQRVSFQGNAAVELTRKLKQWDVQGAAQRNFEIRSPLIPQVHAGPDELWLSFSTGSGIDHSRSGTAGTGTESQPADTDQVFRAWRENESLVPLLGGGFAPLPLDWLNRYGERILALLMAKEAAKEAAKAGAVLSGKMTLPAHLIPQMALLLEEMQSGDESGIEAFRPEVTFDAAISALMRSLRNTDGIPDAPLPSELRADLRSYQQKGVNWLSFLRNAKLGALLADDMGLGKTLQALCVLGASGEPKAERALVICPTSVLQAWQEQIRKFRPDLKVSTYYGPARRLDPEAQITLTTYGILRLDLERLMGAGREWTTLIVDEAQTLKNPESQLAQAAHALARSCPASFRIALSGTPIENRIDDLWSQFEFINPGMLGRRETFRDEAGTPGNLSRLRTRIRPFILRRLKKEVAPELPPRTEIVLRCEFSEKEQDLYDSLLAATRQEVLGTLGQEKLSVFAMLEILLRLRQASCHPALLPGGESTLSRTQPSAKVDLLLQSLETSLSLGHRALIFSQWTSFLDLIEPQLRERGITHSRLDGTTRDREKVVTEFQTDQGPAVMLISLKAGGVGLTLTAADHIYIMDPWWNPAVENQAADRAHRIGQKNPVLIHRLVAQNTVEDRILELQKKKLELAGAVLENSGAAVALTRDDLLSLLAD
ncbi:MAG: DEAD/DEAH box helicase [Methylotenera sp.]|nr:DEAD/DEAH box helicase [Oligoflexia bacterium]